MEKWVARKPSSIIGDEPIQSYTVYAADGSPVKQVPLPNAPPNVAPSPVPSAPAREFDYDCVRIPLDMRLSLDGSDSNIAESAESGDSLSTRDHIHVTVPPIVWWKRKLLYLALSFLLFLIFLAVFIATIKTEAISLSMSFIFLGLGFGSFAAGAIMYSVLDIYESQRSFANRWKKALDAAASPNR
jgi:hypothetical protein